MSLRAWSRLAYEMRSMLREMLWPRSLHSWRTGNETRWPYRPYVCSAMSPHRSPNAVIEIDMLERTPMLPRYLMWIGDMARK